MMTDQEITVGLIEKNWPITSVRLEQMTKQGMAGSVGMVNSNEGKYVYKVAGDWKDKNGLRNDTAVFDLLNKRGFTHITKLLKTVESNNFIEVNGRFVYLLEYVEGKVPEINTETYGKLGEISATLHSITDYPLKTLFNPKNIIEVNFIANAKNFLFGEEYLKIAATLPDFSQLPQTVIHTDIAPANAVERVDGKLILIDWDDAGVGPAVLDLGYLLFQFITDDLKIRKDFAETFFTAYLSKREITDGEKKLIFDAGLFFALMYLIHGDKEKRWLKLKWVLENRSIIEDLIK